MIHRISTTNQTTDETNDEQLASRLKALAHPARLRILRLLAERDRCVCGELVDELPQAQATVSQHLKVLREAGFVVGEIEGPSTCYCLAPEAWAMLREAGAAMAELTEVRSVEPMEVVR